MVDYTDWDQYIASMNKGMAAGVIQGCWIMSSIQAAEDQSGNWAIVNMPKLDDVEGATNYANCGGASWAVSSNCKNTDLAYDFLKTTFGGSVELYDDLLPNAGAIASYLPAAESTFTCTSFKTKAVEAMLIMVSFPDETAVFCFL